MCLSPQKDYLEEMIRDKVPLKIISERMLEVYNEQISSDAVARHRDNHMVQPHSNDDRVQEIDQGDKNAVDLEIIKEATVLSEEEDVVEAPLTPMEALEARVNALEILLAEQTSTGSYTGFTSYLMGGKREHSISYRDIVTELHPDKKDIHGQYVAIVARVKAKMVAEKGLILSDEEFIKPRAELNKKNKAEAEAGLKEAEEELRKREIERKNFRNAIEQLAAAEKRNAR